jgi:hypothetical protein
VHDPNVVGVVGANDHADGTWSDVYPQFCDRMAHLYCFEQ